MKIAYAVDALWKILRQSVTGSRRGALRDVAYFNDHVLRDMGLERGWNHEIRRMVEPSLAQETEPKPQVRWPIVPRRQTR